MFTIDAALALMVILIAYTYVNAQLVRGLESPWSQVQNERIGNDIVDVLHRSGVLYTLNSTLIASTIEDTMITPYKMNTRIDCYEHRTVTHMLVHNIELNSSLPTDRSIAHGQHPFIVFDNEHLFSWRRVPGDDEGVLRNYLSDNFYYDWIEDAEFEKIDGGDAIRVFKQDDWIEIRLTNEQNKALQRLASVTTCEGESGDLIVKEVQDELEIYYDTGRVKYYCLARFWMWIRRPEEL